jgi:hypothetical protein
MLDMSTATLKGLHVKFLSLMSELNEIRIYVLTLVKLPNAEIIDLALRRSPIIS